MNGMDDFMNLWLSSHLSYSKLAFFLFGTPIKFLSNNFYADLGSRATHFLFVKMSFDIGGLNPTIHYALRIILFSCNAIVLFKFLLFLRVNKLFSFFGALVYCTAVQSFSFLHFVGEPTLVYHFFILLCFYIFITYFMQQDKSNPLVLSFLLFCTALLAMKSKQIGIIIPIILILFTLFVKRNIHGEMKRRVPFFCCILLLYLIPFTSASWPSGNLHDATSSIHILKQFQAYYLNNPATQFDQGEYVPALVSPIYSYKTVSGSLMGTYKFLFGWLCAVLIMVWISSLYATYHQTKKFSVDTPFLFIMLWHVVEVSMLVLYFNEFFFGVIRYVGIALPSFILVTFYGMQQGFNVLKKYKTQLYVLLVVCVSLTLMSQMYSSSIAIRGGLLSRFVLIHDSLFTIYSDYFHTINASEEVFYDLYPSLFYVENNMQYFDAASIVIEKSKQQKIEELRQITFTEFPAQFGRMYQTRDLSEIQDTLKEKKTIYIATLSDEIPFANKLLLKKIPACPEESSFYCFLKAKIKGQSIHLYVFKVSTDIS